MSYMQRMAQAGSRGFANAAHKTSGTMGSMLFGNHVATTVGGYGIIGGAMAAASYDSSKNTFSSHMAQEGLKLSGDMVMDTAVFGLSTMAVGGMAGMALGIGLTAGLYGAGLNAGSFVQKHLDIASKKYKEDRGIAAPMIQNKRTMASTRQAMSLLGQTRNHGMLGNEASFMHN